MTDELKTTTTTALALYDYGALAGMGQDGLDEDMLVPFLTVLQANSPQIAGETPIEGARAGFLFNTGTGEYFDTKKNPVTFVPLRREEVFVEWKPRSAGGGFVGRRPNTDPVVLDAIKASEKFGKYKTAEGNDLVQTIYVPGMILTDAETPEVIGQVVLAFAKTKIKKWKSYVTKIRGFRGAKTLPLFAHRASIRTVFERNDQGEFWNFDLTPAIIGSNGQPNALASVIPNADAWTTVLETGRRTLDAFSKGTAKIDHETAREDTAPTGDEDAPF